MSHYDLLVRNGTLITPAGSVQADLAVEAEHIVALEPQISGSARHEVDAAGLTILPGVIDAHVHFNEPGRAHWEGFATGTRALAAGGTTTFFDMPLNASPPTLDAASFEAKRAAAEETALVDFGLWGGLVPTNLAQLEELAACGVVGYKAFMCNSGIEDFSAVDDRTLYEGMKIAARLQKLVAVHAEDEVLTHTLAQQALAEGRQGARDYLDSRPVEAELNAIRRALVMAEETGCALHIVHVSSGRGVALVAEARARGCDVTCETCPHYLVLTEEDVERLGAVAKCSSPLRSRQEQEHLWWRLLAGEIEFVGSDHSPAPPEMKTAKNFFEIWGGIAGCQSLLQLLLTEGHALRGLSLTRLSQLTAEAVARRFRLPSKGQLALDMDADFVLVNLSAQGHVRADDLHYRYQYSPYIGRAWQGQVVQTFVRGVSVYERGGFPVSRHGRLVAPE